MFKHNIDQSIESLADADSRFITINGVKIHYKECGKGEPSLLLLHGFGGSLFSWRDMLGGFSRYGRVIAYDRPAFGLSERPLAQSWSGDNPYGSKAQVNTIISMMDQLGISKSVLVAHSAGGTIALAAALEHADRIAALILVAPAVYLYSPVPLWARKYLVKRPVRIMGQALIHPSRLFVRQILRHTWHNPSLITDEIVRGYDKPLHTENWEAGLWEFSLAPHYRDLWKRMGDLKMPVLVIAGDDDKVIPTRHSRRLAQITPKAEFVLIPKSGHMPHEERPQLFLDAVDRFMSLL